MNHYETVFILTPVLSDAQMKEAVEKYHNFIRENGGEIVNQEDWGLRKLAYPIQKKSTGFYHFIEFTAEPSIVENLEIQYKRDDRVIRFLTLRQDKHFLEYAEKRRKLKSQKKSEPEKKAEVTEEQKGE